MGQLPNVTVNIQDGGLGIQPPSNTGIHAKVGVSSAGNANRIIAITDNDQITRQFGSGPLINALADSFMSGSQIIYAVKAASDIAGSIGDIAAAKAGTGNMTATGEVLDEFEVIIEIVDAGRLNTATFRYSLDGGDNFTSRITVPATPGTYVIPGMGITLTFTEGADAANSFKGGDKYSFKTAAPTASIASINAALDVLLETNLTYEGIHVVGESSPSLWAALAARAEEAETKARYIYIVAEACGPEEDETVDDWTTALLDQADGFAHTRVSIVAARAELTDMITGRVVDRNGAGIVMGRVSKLKVHESAGKVIVGALPGVVELRPVGINSGHIAALDEAGFTTFCRYEGLNGNYITNFRMKAEVISDFQYGERRRTMDKACRLCRIAALRFMHYEASDSGIAALSAHLQQPLNIMAGDGEIQTGTIVIPSGQDILATSKLKAKLRIQPIGIMRFIELDIGFENPFLTGGNS